MKHLDCMLTLCLMVCNHRLESQYCTIIRNFIVRFVCHQVLTSHTHTKELRSSKVTHIIVLVSLFPCFPVKGTFSINAITVESVVSVQCNGHLPLTAICLMRSVHF
jgi:hypothetical protein